MQLASFGEQAVVPFSPHPINKGSTFYQPLVQGLAVSTQPKMMKALFPKCIPHEFISEIVHVCLDFAAAGFNLFRRASEGCGEVFGEANKVHAI
mmetsp:Transcript_7215/g.44977  ORF Transcript_7215/g.44977 Transcript_7215/m.44977 type:complete len:94 (+) Transcript_7215:5076-5357(+)